VTITPRIRKLLLAIHIASSIGWFGAVASFIALAIAGRTSRDAELVRAAYLAMKVTAVFVIIPFSLIALLSGVAQSLVTPWGLARHYWVLAKLALTVVATFLLLTHLTPVNWLSNAAMKGTLPDYGWMRVQILAYACGGLAMLIAAFTLAIFKPRGLTRSGLRAQRHPETRGELARK
jgi:hypothetical protein